MNHSASCTVVIRASASRVWQALTEPSIVKQYFYGTQMDTSWTVGEPVFFRGEWEGRPYEDRGSVLAFEPMRTLAFNYWSAFSGHEDTPEKRTVVRYSLATHGDETSVTIEQRNFDSQARADHSAKSWEAVMSAMKTLLETGFSPEK